MPGPADALHSSTWQFRFHARFRIRKCGGSGVSPQAKTKVVLILAVIVTAHLTRKLPAYRPSFGIFLPTLIHVYVFTGLFILIYASASGVAILRLISFAYTYHYLNWFSKTSVIGWHEISRVRLVGIIVLWILAMGIYLVDYRASFVVLLTLSLRHVILDSLCTKQSGASAENLVSD